MLYCYYSFEASALKLNTVRIESGPLTLLGMGIQQNELSECLGFDAVLSGGFRIAFNIKAFVPHDSVPADDDT